MVTNFKSSLDSFPPKPSRGTVGSTLLNSLVNKSPTMIAARKIAAIKPKRFKVSYEKSTHMTETNTHPFILEHRVGTTERVSQMDPMSERFIRSLRIPYKGKYTGRVVASTETIDNKVLACLIQNRTSKLLKSVAPDSSLATSFHLSDLGRPWKAEGWIDPSFRVTTACMLGKSFASMNFDTAKVMMESWSYREPDAACSQEIDDAPVLVTLVNRFEAVKDELLCYSFIMKYQIEPGNPLGGIQGLVHVWINKTYLNAGVRYLPMYFEEAGAPTFILNAATACFGLEIGPSGSVTLAVTSKSGVRKTQLGASHLTDLNGKGILSFWDRIYVANCVPWGVMLNADWQGLGYDLQPGGQAWNHSSATTHLPWQVQHQRTTAMRAYPSFKRNRGVVGGSASASRAMFERPLSERKMAISKWLGRAFWTAIKDDDESHVFDDLIRSLRTEFISDGLVDEMKRVNPEVTATELFDATWNASNEVGRFVFERSLPVVG